MGQKAHFGDLHEEYSALEQARIVVIPAPYDRTSTWLKGADKGPAAIIEASAHMELYDIETDSEVYKKGIFTAEPVDGPELPEDMIEMVAEQVRKHLENDKFVVVVGGEHSVSLGPVRAHIEKNTDITHNTVNAQGLAFLQIRGNITLINSCLDSIRCKNVDYISLL